MGIYVCTIGLDFIQVAVKMPCCLQLVNHICLFSVVPYTPSLTHQCTNCRRTELDSVHLLLCCSILYDNFIDIQLKFKAS